MKQLRVIINTFLMAIIFLIVISSNIFAQDIPILISPLDNDRYVKTIKLTLRWLKVESEESYQVQLAEDQFFSPQSVIFDVIRTSDETTVQVELQNNTKYWWRVRVDSDTAGWSPISKFTTTGFARPVTLLKPVDGDNNLENDVVLFEWSKDSANASYNLHVSLDRSFSDTVWNKFVDEETTELTNLLEGSILYWRVKPYNVDQIPGEWSDVNSFRTKLSTPRLSFPQNFSNNQDTSITFSWQQVSTASIYDFQLSTDEEFESDSLIADTSTTFRNIKFSGLLSEKIYYWRIKARNAFSDTSDWSEISTFKTKLQKPSLVSPAQFSRNIGLDVDLRWSPGEEFDLFRVQFAKDSTFRIKISDTYTEATSILVLNLDYNTRYYWRVNRRNTVGDSSYWTKFNTFKTLLAEPVLLSPADNSSKLSFDIKFEWTPIDSAEIYLFNLAPDINFTSLLREEQVEDTTFIEDSLNIGGVFFWRVKAVNENGDSSDWSDTFLIRTSVLSFSALSIDTTINFSRNPTDTIASIQIRNNSDAETFINQIIAYPDTLFFPNKTSLNLAPETSESLFITADVSEVDTGLTEGFLGLIRELNTLTDTIKIPLNLFSQKALAGFSIDTLVYDTTNSTNPRNKTIRLNNRIGNVTLEIYDMYLEGRDSASFDILTEIEKIGANDSSAITIKFDPQRLDSNIAALVIRSNSYASEIIKLPIIGYGKGGLFSENTIEFLSDLKNNTFGGLISSERKIRLKNEGNLPLLFNIDFSEKFFRILDGSGSQLRIQPGDTLSLMLQYITPNFDSLNVDTLIVSHNGLGKKELKYILNGVFDSAAVVNTLITKLRIQDNAFDPSSDYVIPENTSLQVRLSGELFKQQENLRFKINYFSGGPGKKKSSAETSDNRYIIPYQESNENGLLFKGELFTNGNANNNEIDSLTIFDFKDVQITLNNFSTDEIKIPISVPAENAANADVNWVLFGFPYERIITDSVFKDLGKLEKMEDGQWVVYEYSNNASIGYQLISDEFLSPNQAYFMAQSVQEELLLSYSYDNSVLTRKLSDNIIQIPDDTWKTITNPYNFEVEVDTPAVLYRYDVPAQSFRITNIMRPGEGYFVAPETTELRLINYGEYFPAVFPKSFESSTWYLTISADNGTKQEEVYITPDKKITSADGSDLKVYYKKAPEIDNSFDLFIEGGDDSKYVAGYLENSIGGKWNVVLRTQKQEEIKFNLEWHGEISANLNYTLIDLDRNSKIDNDQSYAADGSNNLNLLLLVGSAEYINQQIQSLSLINKLDFNLSQNYPNPFNPSTIIKFTLAESQFTTLKVYDILGREVKTLISGNKNAGSYSIKFNSNSSGSPIASGVYIYQLKSGSNIISRKMLLLK